MTIKEGQLRELPDIDLLQDIFANPKVSRLVKGDYTVEFKTEFYRVKHIPGIVPNKTRVDVIHRPFAWPEITVVWDDVEYPVRPLETVEGGFFADSPVIEEEYKAQPETPTMRGLKRIENLAFGIDPKKDAVPFAGTEVFGYQADDVPVSMPKRGAVIDMGAHEFVDREISVTELIQRLFFRDGSAFRG